MTPPKEFLFFGKVVKEASVIGGMFIFLIIAAVTLAYLFTAEYRQRSPAAPAAPAASLEKRREISEGEKALCQKAAALVDGYAGNISALQQATGYIEKALAVNPDNTEAFVLLAKIAYKAGRLADDTYAAENVNKAREYVERALTLDPGNAEALLILASMAHKEENYDTAIARAGEALKLKDSPAARSILAKANFEKGSGIFIEKKKPAEALKYFEDTVKYDPAHADAYYALGVCYRQLAKKKDRALLAKAEAAFKRSLALDPGNKKAATELKTIRRKK